MGRVEERCNRIESKIDRMQKETTALKKGNKNIKAENQQLKNIIKGQKMMYSLPLGNSLVSFFFNISVPLEDELMMDLMNNNPAILRQIVFSDECTFCPNEFVSRHNCQHWSDVNPQWIEIAAIYDLHQWPLRNT
ncbi:hypothetical protein FQA39_LY12649 [Lamprigera yunnana]|nr:hypothetical protein FQA39_LY12649 [Lamprigera yunnana]